MRHRSWKGLKKAGRYLKRSPKGTVDAEMGERRCGQRGLARGLELTEGSKRKSTSGGMMMMMIDDIRVKVTVNSHAGRPAPFARCEELRTY